MHIPASTWQRCHSVGPHRWPLPSNHFAMAKAAHLQHPAIERRHMCEGKPCTDVTRVSPMTILTLLVIPSLHRWRNNCRIPLDLSSLDLGVGVLRGGFNCTSHSLLQTHVRCRLQFAKEHPSLSDLAYHTPIGKNTTATRKPLLPSLITRALPTLWRQQMGGDPL